MHQFHFLHALRALTPDACSPGTFCATQVASGVAALGAAFAPASVVAGGEDQFVWLWRGVITASLLLNLFFVKSVYKKVQRIGPHQRALATLEVAVRYLAVEAIEHGIKRQADTLIIGMLEDVKKIAAHDSSYE